MPSLVAQNGLHASFDIILSPSQAFIPPKQSMLSEPPVRTVFTDPLRIKFSAWPIAWFEEEQADATVKHGP